MPSCGGAVGRWLYQSVLGSGPIPSAPDSKGSSSRHTATVYVPVKDLDGVTESGKPAGTARGVNFLRMEGQSAVYAVGSGVYHFESSL